MNYPGETPKLVQAMHDSVCRCGGWCEGAENDLWNFLLWVEEYWGSTRPLEEYLKGLRDGSTNNE